MNSDLETISDSDALKVLTYALNKTLKNINQHEEQQSLEIALELFSTLKKHVACKPPLRVIFNALFFTSKIFIDGVHGSILTRNQRSELKEKLKYGLFDNKIDASKDKLLRSSESTESVESTIKITLHEAIKIVLLNSNGKAMHTKDIADEVFKKKLYLKKNGEKALYSQVSLRCRNHPELFESLGRDYFRLH